MTTVLATGAFEATITDDVGTWNDWLTWQAEGKDWRRVDKVGAGEGSSTGKQGANATPASHPEDFVDIVGHDEGETRAGGEESEVRGADPGAEIADQAAEPPSMASVAAVNSPPAPPISQPADA